MAYFTAPARPSTNPKDIMACTRRQRWAIFFQVAFGLLGFGLLLVVTLPVTVPTMLLEHLKHERIRARFKRDAERRARLERR
jgi:hypothetical protein